MGLHVVTGSANAGKTGLVHGAVRAAVQGGRTAVLLLPSVPDVRRAQHELAAECPLGLSIMGLDPYLDSLWLRISDGTAIIPPARRTLLVSKAVASTKLDLLAESATRPGFTRIVAGLITRAGEAGVLRKPIGGKDGVAGELLAILASYARLLEAEACVERVEAHNAVTDRVDTLNLPGVIAVNRFGSLTPAQERFIVAASRKSEVWLGCTWRKGMPATAAAEGMVRRLSAVGSLHVADEPSASDTPLELAVIEQNLFDPQAGRDAGAEPCGAVVLSEAWGSEAESARIAREVQDAIREGVAPGEIAVVFRQAEAHVGRLRGAFSDAGILAEYDLLMPVGATGLATALSQLLRFMCAEGERRDLIGFLRTAYAPGQADDLDALDASLRMGRVVGRRHLLARVGDADEDVAAFLRRAEQLCKGAVDRDSEEGWWSLLSEMMRSAHGGVDPTDDHLDLDAKAMRSIMGAIGEMAASATIRFGAQDLLAFLHEATVSVYSEERADRVQVLGAERVRGRRFSRVILGGLTADEFPRTATEDALTSPHISDVMSDVGIDVTPRVGMDAERLLFYQVVTRARHKLVLSRRVSDDDGDPARPSPLLEELLDLYRDPAAEKDSWYKGPVPRRVMTLDDLSGGPDSPVTERRELRRQLATSAISSADSTEPRIAHARWKGRARGPCLDPAIAVALEGRQVFSASEIETYLQCPYGWYVQRVLGPESLEAEIDAGAIGQAAHEVMRRFYERFRTETGASRVSPGNLTQALAIHDVVAAEVLSGLRAQGLSEEMGIRAVARSTRRLVADDATFLEGFDPKHHEWAFGFDDEPEDFGTFSLRGRIDRVDVGPQGFVVTDYKSGDVAQRCLEKFIPNGLVQLPLYAEVVRRRLEPGPMVGAFYRSIRGSGKPRGFYLDGALDKARFSRTDACDESRIEATIAEAISLAAGAVEGIRAGRVERVSRTGKCPAYCPARTYCTEAQ